MWPFECIGPNGQTYLHNDNWKAFIKERDVEYPHDWNHRRALITLCMPRDKIDEIPGVTDHTMIPHVEEDFSTIFQPYPAHLRTLQDPDAKEPSFNIFVEDGYAQKPLGEKIVLFSTWYNFFPSAFLLLGSGTPERFALFRDKYWRVWSVSGGGIGVAAPPKPPIIEKKKKAFRSLDDDWI